MELITEQIAILIVDPNPAVVEAIRSCFPAPRYLCQTATKSLVAMEILKQSEFNLVLSALDCTNMDGMDLLRRGLARSPETSFLALTDPFDVRSEVWAKQLGAADCIRKPFHERDLIDAVERVIERRRAKVAQEIFDAISEKPLHERTEHLHRVLRQIGLVQRTSMEMLATAIDRRTDQADLHSLRVQHFGTLLAERCGYPRENMRDFAYGALLHDVGKVAIPDSILLKPGRLTADEYSIMQYHSMFGYQVLSRVPHLQKAATIALFHHERVDGEGYPFHLQGESIPLEARIFAVADTLDVITSGRPYCPRRTLAEARAEICRHAGTQFDTAVVDVFMNMPDEEWNVANMDVTKRYSEILPVSPAEPRLHPAVLRP